MYFNNLIISLINNFNNNLISNLINNFNNNFNNLKMSFSSKGKYEGEMSEGWYHGKGTFLYENGVKYEGNFKKGEFHGEGVLIYPNGVIIILNTNI